MLFYPTKIASSYENIFESFSEDLCQYFAVDWERYWLQISCSTNWAM